MEESVRPTHHPGQPPGDQQQLQQQQQQNQSLPNAPTTIAAPNGCGTKIKTSFSKHNRSGSLTGFLALTTLLLRGHSK